MARDRSMFRNNPSKQNSARRAWRHQLKRLRVETLEDRRMLSADFNYDGVVDAADYSVWRDSANLPEAAQIGAAGDATYDGLVNDADYQLWRSQYGTTVDPTSVRVLDNAIWNNQVYISWQNVTHAYELDSTNLVIDTWKVDDNGDGDPRNDANRIQAGSQVANGLTATLGSMDGVESGATSAIAANADGSFTVTLSRQQGDGLVETAYTIKPDDANVYGELLATPTWDSHLTWGLVQTAGVDGAEPIGAMATYDAVNLAGVPHAARQTAVSGAASAGDDYWLAPADHSDFVTLLSTQNQWATGLVLTDASTPMTLRGDAVMASPLVGWDFERSATVRTPAAAPLLAGETYQFSAVFHADQDLNLAGFSEFREERGWSNYRSDLTGTNSYRDGSVVPTSNVLQLKATLGDGDAQLLTGDVDGDGLLEVVRVEASQLLVYDETGRSQLSMPLPDESHRGVLATLEDFNGDGVLDIGVGANNLDDSVSLTYLFEGDGALLQTFERELDIWGGRLLPVAQIAPGVVLVGGYSDGPDPRGLFAYDFDTGEELWGYGLGRPELQLASVADIDADGRLESTVGWVTVNNGNNVNGTTDRELYLTITDDNGANLLSKEYAKPNDGAAFHVITDFEQDGAFEVLAIERHFQGYYEGNDEVHLYDLQGNIVHTYTGPWSEEWLWAVDDIDNDGRLNVIVGGHSVLTVLDDQLQEMDSIEEDGFVQLTADLNGNGSPEIVTLNKSNVLRVYDNGLNLLDSIQLSGDDRINNSTRASDVDADGVVELLVQTSVGAHVLSFAPTDETPEVSLPSLASSRSVAAAPTDPGLVLATLNAEPSIALASRSGYHPAFRQELSDSSAKRADLALLLLQQGSAGETLDGSVAEETLLDDEETERDATEAADEVFASLDSLKAGGLSP